LGFLINHPSFQGPCSLQTHLWARLEFTAAANDLSILIQNFHRGLTCPWSCAYWLHKIVSTLP